MTFSRQAYKDEIYGGYVISFKKIMGGFVKATIGINLENNGYTGVGSEFGTSKSTAFEHAKQSIHQIKQKHASNTVHYSNYQCKYCGVNFGSTYDFNRHKEKTGHTEFIFSAK